MSNQKNVLLKFPFSERSSHLSMEDFVELKVQERTAVLKHEIENRDEALSIASHELKNPLGTLLLQITSMGRSLVKLFKAEQEAPESSLNPWNPVVEKLLKSLASCERQTKRLAMMVDQPHGRHSLAG